jgi:hypothetical protein
MVRTHVNLTESQKAQLQQISQAQHIPVAQLIRQAIDRFLQNPSFGLFEHALKQTFGLWRDHEIEDSREYVRQLRKGWEERLERMESPNISS